MRIKKGQKLRVNCSRKGAYDAVALEAFDTEKDEWYQVAVDQDEAISGASNGQYWFKGDEIPCRKGHARITIRK